MVEQLGWRCESPVRRDAHLTVEDMPSIPVFIADLRRGHFVAVIDGVVPDTWDSSKMRSQKPDATRHNRHLVRGIWLPPAGFVRLTVQEERVAAAPPPRRRRQPKPAPQVRIYDLDELPKPFNTWAYVEFYAHQHGVTVAEAFRELTS